MSIAKLMEDEAHLLLQELQQHVINQVSKGNKINQRLQEILVHLEAHVNNTPVAAPAPMAPIVDAEPAPTPVVPVAMVEETVVVETPQTVAQEQSASNVAN